MPNKYYYLVSSLPFLKFGEEPPIPGEKFLYECRKHLSERDLDVIDAADLGNDKKSAGSSFLLEWKRFNGELRKELAKIRKASKRKETHAAPDQLKGVMAEETPLLMERAFERIRWDFIDEKAKEHFFDINFLASYFLKVQILERLAAFDKDKGENLFYKLCEV